MSTLLDTHAMLWFALGDPRMSTRALRVLAGGEGPLVLSVASIWEIAIKTGLGQLELPEGPAVFVRRLRNEQGVKILPVRSKHALRVGGLPYHHKDPFDRLLIAQAMVEGLPILTSDRMFHRYPVRCVW